MDSCAYQDAIYHPYADMKKSSDALFAVLAIPGFKLARLVSLFLCDDTSVNRREGLHKAILKQWRFADG